MASITSEQAEQDDLIARALAAAEAVFNQDEADVEVSEPSGRAAVEAAVRHLGVKYQQMPGIARKMMARSGDAAASLSSDPLQGLSEIIQNADDLDASEVRFLLREGDLLAAHNGTGVMLPDLVTLATPWLTTKAEDAQATGRFGIGLMTLRSLSPSLEIHSGDYHVRFGHPALAVADVIEIPSRFALAGWTVLRLPLEGGDLTIGALDEWLGEELLRGESGDRRERVQLGAGNLPPRP